MKYRAIDKTVEYLSRAAQENPEAWHICRCWYSRVLLEGRADFQSTDIVLDFAIIEAVLSN